MASVQPEHWLARIARQSQLDGSDSLEVDSRRPIGDIWRDVCRACDLSEDELAHHVAASLCLQEANLATADLAALKLIPKKLAQRYMVFPVRQDDRMVVVATSHPIDLDAEWAIAFSCARSVAFSDEPALLHRVIDARRGINSELLRA